VPFHTDPRPFRRRSRKLIQDVMLQFYGINFYQYGQLQKNRNRILFHFPKEQIFIQQEDA
jgi:hypothetical protein